MDYPRPCGCKGCRVCLLCEKEFGIETKNYGSDFQKLENQYVYCPKCNNCYKGWNTENIQKQHPEHNSEIGKCLPGILVKTDFITDAEQTALITGVDEMDWDVSQSGRRKQNFGPKTNFKKMKLATGSFRGFPLFSKFVQDKFETVPLLVNFQTIEQCSLEYDPVKGASIDPHIDDCWIWGERVITVNCLGDSVLTLTKYSGDPTRYNLSEVERYKSKLIPEPNQSDFINMNNVVIRIPMPNRSLIVLYGSARYHWEHSVLREDIIHRRVCIAYREFTPEYLQDGCNYSKSEEIFEKSKNFWKHSV